MTDSNPVRSLTIRVMRGDDLIVHKAITEQSISIGSAEDALLRIEDASVSDLHAVINVDSDAVQLLDLGTESGIQFNGEQISNVSLSSGDAFQIGDVSVQVTFEDAVAEEQPAPAKSLLAAPSAGTRPRAANPFRPNAPPEAGEEEERTSPRATRPSAADPLAAAVFGDVEEAEAIEEDITEDVMAFIMRSGTAQSNLGIDPRKPRVLEVNQVWGDLLLDTKHYPKKGRPITIGSSTGFRWNFLGVNLGWVRSPFDKILPITPPVWSDVSTDWRNDFYTPDQSLPDSKEYNLFKWEGGTYTARVAANWDGFADIGDRRFTFDELVADGKATKSATGYEIPVTEETRIVIDIDGVVYFAHMVQPGKRVLAKMAENVDYPMLGIFFFCAFLGAMFGVLMWFSKGNAENEMVEIPDRFVQLLIERPEPEKREDKKPAANPDAGEGAKAKKEEGKVGKKDAKMQKAKGNKKEIRKTEQDRQIAENAGVLGAMRDAGDLDGVFGSAGLNSQLTGGIGGLIGAKGTQIGSGGLGSRGSGLGGGGTAEGLGGLGTKGIGSGSSGFGAGGGNFGAKGSGNISAVGGDPIILGALDRSLIDEVIKRSMSQIRYCYQRELTKDPSLNGKLVVKFTIAGDGSVSQAGKKSSTMGNAAVEQCVIGRFYRMQFPEPKGGGIVVVSYPFLFAPGS